MARPIVLAVTVLGCGASGFAGTALCLELYGREASAPPVSTRPSGPLHTAFAVAPLPTVPQPLAEAPDDVAAEEAAPAAETTSLEEDTPEQRAPSREQRFATLDERFAAQGVDRQWRAETEGALTTAFAPLRAGGVTRQVIECRSDMCVTTMEHPQAEIPDELLVATMNQARLPFEQLFRYEEGRTLIYTMRPTPAAAAE